MTPASFILLTTGERPDELARAIASIEAQAEVIPEIVVISNGAGQIPVPDGVDLYVSRENLGIPGGRNLGAADSHHEVMFFLDDDAWFAAPDAAATTLAAFAENPSLGIVGFRIADPVTGRSARRHVPRLRVTDPTRSSDATTFLGGACAIRRSVFETCGPYPQRFFYSHEETDLAWRAIDAGFVVRYRGDVLVLHPAGAPSRHPEYYFRTARNRVWLARRRLPWLLALPHVATQTVRSLVLAGSRPARNEVRRGFVAGWREDPGERAPIRWRTAWRMLRLGRPPVF